MSLVGKTIPRRLHRLTSFSIVTARLVAATAFSAGTKKIPPKSLRPCRARGSLTRRPHASPGRSPRRPRKPSLKDAHRLRGYECQRSGRFALRFAPGAPARRANREAYHDPESPAIFMICWILRRFARDTEGVTGAFAAARVRHMAVFPKLVLQVLTMG